MTTHQRYVLMVAVLGLAACAPEAFTNREATGFNGYVDKISKVCAPLQLGMAQLSNPLMGGVSGNQYDYWLDATSRLYYRKLQPAAYRSAINGFFSGGNDATLDCIIANLPPA